MFNFSTVQSPEVPRGRIKRVATVVEVRDDPIPAAPPMAAAAILTTDEALPRPAGGWLRRAGPFATVLVAGAAGLALTIAAGFSVAGWEDRRATEEFKAIAEDHARTLQAGLDEYLSKITALRAFFNASTGGVSRKEFTSFARELMDDNKAILDFSWIPRVTRLDRPSHELAGISDGVYDYQIKAIGLDGQMGYAPVRDEYFPVYFTSGLRTPRSFGINLFDGGVRQQPLERARDGDRLAASGNFQLQAGIGDRNGFFIVAPVYRPDLPHDTVEDRRRNLEGFVQGVFQFDVMVDTILADTKAPLDILLYDADADLRDVPVHARAAETARARATQKSQALDVPTRWLGGLDAGDKHWLLVLHPRASAHAVVRHHRAWIVSGAMLAIVGLVVAYMLNSIANLSRLRAANASASAQARTDMLTGLANRRGFVEQLHQAFADVARGGAPFAVHFVDLDAFKDVNDTQGHSAGDELLKEVAARLVGAVRANDVVARFGGDEFAVLQSAVCDPAAAGLLAAKIVANLGVPYVVAGGELHVTASIGIALHAVQADDGPKAIMMQADLALYRAKGDGGGCLRFHTGALDQEVHLRVTLAEELRHAIERDQLELHYQTQVEIRTGRIVGLEVLVRWRHPLRGMILPSIFVPIAEHSGMIMPMGRWILDRVCRQVAEWRDQGIDVPPVAINVSCAQLRRSSEFEHDVAASFARWDIGRDAIELELTESVLMEVTQHESDMLGRLRALGATIAIDDFGTGYSSLKYLTTYPINRLKIARELIAEVTTDKRTAVVVRSTIRLARDLGIEIIAEGVEHAAQARFLLDAGCSHAQGYYYSRPATADQVVALLPRINNVVRLMA